MRYPVNDYPKWYIAQGYGAKTAYGYHDGDDLNLKTGGNTDLGQALFAIADGEVTSVHDHTTGFGKHVHINHRGPWGEVWSHYAHCNEIFVSVGDRVKEGQMIATLGNTGNSMTTHCHFAIKLAPTGIDGVAKTLDDLKKWTSAIAFVERWMHVPVSEVPQVLQKYGKGSLADLVVYMDDLIRWNEEKGNLLEQEQEAKKQSDTNLSVVWDTILKNTPAERVKRGDLTALVSYLTEATQNEDKVISLQKMYDQATQVYQAHLVEAQIKITALETALADLKEKVQKLQDQAVLHEAVIEKPPIQKLIEFFTTVFDQWKH